MKDKKNLNENDNLGGEQSSEPAYTGKTYAYIAIGLCAACAVALGLIFTALGIYALIAAILLSLAALAFLNTQKKKNNFSWLKIIFVCTYVLLGISVTVFVGGLFWSAIV